jgi:hypothetical protein
MLLGFFDANMASVMSVHFIAGRNIKTRLEISKYKAIHVLQRNVKVTTTPNVNNVLLAVHCNISVH